MPWYYLYDEKSGRLVSETDVTPTDLPAGLAVLERADRLDHRVEMWDDAGGVTARPPKPPPKTAYQAFSEKPEVAAVLAKLSAADLDVIEEAMTPARSR